MSKRVNEELCPRQLSDVPLEMDKNTGRVMIYLWGGNPSLVEGGVGRSGGRGMSKQRSSNSSFFV